MSKIIVFISLMFFGVNISVADSGDSSFFGELFKGMANEAGKQIIRAYAEKIRKDNENNQQKYQPEYTPTRNVDDNDSGDLTIDDEIRNIVVTHFEADNQCQVNRSMEYYYDLVAYEQNTIPKDKLEKVKSNYCKNIPNGTYTIRNNNINVENKMFKGYLLKRATYYVDYSAYSKSKQKFVTGSTGVVLVLTGTSPYRILSESQFDRQQN